jgi:NAD(P)-dependent dehydrogenase (short-subunit alcohol dehydrogenase family)
MTRRKVLITGAASGIGKAAAERFAAEGCDILANDIQENKLSQLLESLPKGDHLMLAGSYADQQTINAGKQLIKDKWGTVDVLVNCAGLFEKTDPVKMEINEWRRVFDIMVNGSILISQLAAEFMPANSRMIHITSIHGTRAEYSASSYSMAKAAINQFCRSLAIELAEKNILVNAIAPGFVDTAMSVVNGENELESDWFKQNYINSHHLPLRRAAQPKEIAGVAYFLAGPDASYITGQVITVDGGLTITF